MNPARMWNDFRLPFLIVAVSFRLLVAAAIGVVFWFFITKKRHGIKWRYAKA
jgi:hypothetical protein